MILTTTIYDFEFRYEEKRILIELPDGGRAMVKHKSVHLTCTYRRTGDCIKFKFTGKGNVYEDEKQISETEAKSELTRLSTKEFAEKVYREVQLMLYL